MTAHRFMRAQAQPSQWTTCRTALITTLVYPKYTYTGQHALVKDGGDDWRIKLLSSGTLNVLKKLKVDIFMVGGGAGGGSANASSAGGGGGGYTLTQKNVLLSEQ